MCRALQLTTKHREEWLDGRGGIGVFLGSCCWWGGLTVSLNVSPLPRATCLISIINRVPSYLATFVATFRNTRVTCENKIKGRTGSHVAVYVRGQDFISWINSIHTKASPYQIGSNSNKNSLSYKRSKSRTLTPCCELDPGIKINHIY